MITLVVFVLVAALVGAVVHRAATLVEPGGEGGGQVLHAVGGGYGICAVRRPCAACWNGCARHSG